MRGVVLAALAALVLSVLGVIGTAAPAAGYEPRPGGTFNVPRHWGSQKEKYRIVRKVERAINKTPRKTAGQQSRIYISTFLLDRKRSVDALVRACRRGVSVRVILDEDITSRHAKRLITTLNADNVRDRNRDGKPDKRAKRGPCDTKKKDKKEKDGKKKGKKGKKGGDKKGKKGGGKKKDGNKKGKKGKNKGKLGSGPDGKGPRVYSDAQALRSVSRQMRRPLTWGRDRSYVKKCRGSCRGGGGNMHSKFYLFSRTGTARNVVMVSSTNLNHGGALLGWNDLFTMVDRPKSYRGYARIHRQMTADRKAGKKRVQITDGPFVSRFFPMVNARKRRDPTMHDLSLIKCRGPLGRTKVYVSMFYWKGVRGNYIANRLFQLARQRCDVRIIYGAPSIQLAKRLRKAARSGLIDLYDSRRDKNKNGVVDSRAHSKYVLVKGHYGRDKRAWRVFTGSQNWVAGSLNKSDETTLKIRSRPAYGDYVANWNKVRRHSREMPRRR